LTARLSPSVKQTEFLLLMRSRSTACSQVFLFQTAHKC